MGDIKILSSGIQTTIQDLGRYGYRSHGIPLSGSMDHSATQLANFLVGNNDNDAVLECTMLGPKIEFLCNTYIAITGAKVDIYLNDIKQKMNCTIAVGKNSQLKFGRIHQGCRFYIAFASGINIKAILGSRSTDTISGIGHPILKKHDILTLFNNQEERLFIELNPLVNNLKERKVSALPGPEYHLIERLNIENCEFTIHPSSNRMAYTLNSNLEITHQYEMISSGVLPGTVQLTPSGQFNILMRDAQTTGGYPRVLQIFEEDIGYLAQRRGGEIIQFIVIDIV